jgi:glycosyltransferase involved in cell wall biosynthesis
MAKIAIFDPYLRKFTAGMEKWWIAHGHEVHMNRYYDPQLAEWADIIWFDTVDNNLASATNPSQAIMDDANNYQPWDLHHMDLVGKRVIVRAIDIEVWQGHHMASKWDFVDDLIFIAPHVRSLVDTDALPEVNLMLGVHTVPCAVDLDEWEWAERGHGHDIAVVSEKWTSKGTDLILQIALKLKSIDPRYKIHWLGQRSDYPWEYAYFDEFVEHHGLNIEFTNILNDGRTVDDFLEGKNYLLHASHKEAFSYATAEAMAKGIKPVIHRFYGADDLWPGMTWDSIDQAVQEIIGGEYNSAGYREYLVKQGYTLPQMMEKIDKIIGV